MPKDNLAYHSHITFRIILLEYSPQVFLLVCISTISAQAPGDEDERCTANDTSYDATVKTLMDSFNYVNLLSSGDNPAIMNTVWNEFSFDGRDQINYPKPTYVSLAFVGTYILITRNAHAMPCLTCGAWLTHVHIMCVVHGFFIVCAHS